MVFHRKQKIGVAADRVINSQGDTAPQDAKLGKRRVDNSALFRFDIGVPGTFDLVQEPAQSAMSPNEAGGTLFCSLPQVHGAAASIDGAAIMARQLRDSSSVRFGLVVPGGILSLLNNLPHAFVRPSASPIACNLAPLHVKPDVATTARRAMSCLAWCKTACSQSHIAARRSAADYLRKISRTAGTATLP
jgi:hypothetical protein